MEMRGQNILSVSQVTDAIKELIESSFPVLKIEGEISNSKFHQGGHFYFTLKDEHSQISAVMWKGSTAYLDFSPKDGQKVCCTGKIAVYGPQGRYQIVVSKMEIAGIGNILQMLEERKRRLSEEGLFDQSRKRSLPIFPRTVGVVTSPTGAAIRDILQVARRRNPCVSFIVFPALVQGEGAAESIIKKIRIANHFNLCDVLIVGRGGGSLEDLLPFSEEKLIREIALSKIPIVSAVGHEIDWALSDFVADIRAPTPSAAAEIVVPEKIAIIQTLQNYQITLYDSIKKKTENMKLTVRTFSPDNFESKFRNIEQPILARFDNAKVSLLQNMSQKLKDTKQVIKQCMQVLESSSPETILSKGYSLVRDKSSGKVIRDAKKVLKDSELEIIPAFGKINAKVTDVNSNFKIT